MRRTVRAWAILRDGKPHDIRLESPSPWERGLISVSARGTLAPCTITYDDGKRKPAPRRTQPTETFSGSSSTLVVARSTRRRRGRKVAR